MLLLAGNYHSGEKPHTFTTNQQDYQLRPSQHHPTRERLREQETTTALHGTRKAGWSLLARLLSTSPAFITRNPVVGECVTVSPKSRYNCVCVCIILNGSKLQVGMGIQLSGEIFLSASDPGFTLKSYEKTKITKSRVNTVYAAVWRDFTNIPLTKQDDLCFKTPSLHQAWN